jgi:hypothetical protein
MAEAARLGPFIGLHITLADVQWGKHRELVTKRFGRGSLDLAGACREGYRDGTTCPWRNVGGGGKQQQGVNARDSRRRQRFRG